MELTCFGRFCNTINGTSQIHLLIFTKEIDSQPPTTTDMPLEIICLAAALTTIKLNEHRRLTAIPETVMGKPTAIAVLRAKSF
jgi:hypothetical protein